MPPEPTGDLRCFCRTRPRLATYGVDKNDDLFVHVKVYKGEKIYGEIIFTGGKIRLRCRVCFRWHSVSIRQGKSPVLNLDRSVGDSFPIS